MLLENSLSTEHLFIFYCLNQNILTFQTFGMIFVVHMPHKSIIFQKLMRRMMEVWKCMWGTTIAAKSWCQLTISWAEKSRNNWTFLNVGASYASKQIWSQWGGNSFLTPLSTYLWDIELFRDRDGWCSLASITQPTWLSMGGLLLCLVFFFLGVWQKQTNPQWIWLSFHKVYFYIHAHICTYYRKKPIGLNGYQSVHILTCVLYILLWLKLPYKIDN